MVKRIQYANCRKSDNIILADVLQFFETQILKMSRYNSFHDHKSAKQF